MTRPTHDYWARRVLRYKAKFFARSTDPQPRAPNVVHLFSAKIQGKGDYRYWAFRTEGNQLAFVNLYANAEICEDPCP